ncbi:MAG TPA: adenylate/guanylate cyclase domain-containing protein, partial [Spirochaetia bacterium]|nr:adenylate/guanylate cyclase domain-containing protein [Spirochaetia bacterium]
SRGISSPLITLSHEALRVQTGDLSAQVEIKSEDEVGVLSRAFNTMTHGLREREREREVFGRVVSPEVREKLLSGQLALGGETRRVSVLFSDIRGFSTMVEETSPNEAVTFLNEYLTEMSEAVRPYGGYINNFIGDAIVVIFGAPLDLAEKERHSVEAATTMRERLAELNQRRLERGLQAIKSGIGISTGEVVAGQIGSMERLQYTVIGDAVNVAARLETLTKEQPDFPILINGATADALKGNSEIGLKALGPHQVKGRSEPVRVFAVVSRRKKDGTELLVR